MTLHVHTVEILEEYLILGRVAILPKRRRGEGGLMGGVGKGNPLPPPSKITSQPS